MEKKLKVKYSTFKTDLSFNDWVKEVNFGKYYTEPTPYFQGNVTRSESSTLYQSVEDLFPKVSFKDKIINKFKIKLKQNG
jgi:hypothetical protein